MTLVEVPIEQACPLDDNNPFQSVIPIDFAVCPPISDSLDAPQIWMEIELVKHFGFVLDVEADEMFPNQIEYSLTRTLIKYSQYIHRSGVAILQIVPGKGLIWVNNRLFLTSSVSSNKISSPHLNIIQPPEVLLAKVEEACKSIEWLNEFWTSCMAKNVV